MTSKFTVKDLHTSEVLLTNLCTKCDALLKCAELLKNGKNSAKCFKVFDGTKSVWFGDVWDLTLELKKCDNPDVLKTMNKMAKVNFMTPGGTKQLTIII